MGKIKNTRSLCIISMLTAITTVLAIFGTLRIGTAIKIPLKFISVFVTSALFGPVWGGISALIGDILNAFIVPVGPWIPFLTLTEFIGGFIYGLFFYNKSFNPKKATLRILTCAIMQFMIDMFINTGILTSYGYFPSYSAGFTIRLGAGILKGVIIIVALFIILRFLPEFNERISGSFREYANSFQVVTRPGLERIKALLDEMGNPQKNLKFIHIAGTNGKGSVASYLQNMLTLEGYKTGKYISPNLIKVNERRSINGEDISDNNLNKLLDYTEKLAGKVKKNIGEIPTQFEIWTAVALKYFYEEKCDLVVLETGLGGRLDATNVVENTKVSVITRIDFDHMEYLGNTLESIATEKAGIIKENSVVVSAPQHEEVGNVLKKIAKEKNCEIIFSSTPKLCGVEDIYERFSTEKYNVTLGLGGINQVENAMVSVICAEKLDISKANIEKGLELAKNPARFEKIGDKLIFDGGHNPSGFGTLKANLDRYYPDEKPIFIMASMRDKDITRNLEIIKDKASEIRFVKVKNNERSANPEELEKVAKSLGINANGFESLELALNNTENSLTVICGSLYLYKDYKENILN